MRIGIIGTGNVGITIATKLVELGHQVKVGSRNSGNEKAVAFVAENGANASEGTFADAAAFGEVNFNCTKGGASLEALRMAQAKNLNNKVLIDVSNPLDSASGMPPSLLISNTNSLGEEIQKEFPAALVVKTLNTIWCGLMVNPRQLSESHTIFMCGNSDEAKSTTKKILKEFGWMDEEILDLGDITNARGTESYLPIWLRIYLTTKTGAFNIKIVQ